MPNLRFGIYRYRGTGTQQTFYLLQWLYEQNAKVRCTGRGTINQVVLGYCYLLLQGISRTHSSFGLAPVAAAKVLVHAWFTQPVSFCSACLCPLMNWYCHFRTSNAANIKYLLTFSSAPSAFFLASLPHHSSPLPASSTRNGLAGRFRP